MLEPSEATVHLDGFRVVPVKDEGQLKVIVRLLIEGQPKPEVCPDLTLFTAPETAPGAEAAQERALIVGQAMCTFVNSGGGTGPLWLLADQFCSKVPDVRPVHELVSVLPPPGGPLLIWKKGDGTYLKVQEGEEGFTETLSERELQEVLGDQLKEPQDADWP